MGPLPMDVEAEVVLLFMAGEVCVEAGSGCARGVVRLALCWEAADDWCVCGVVGVLGDAPWLGRREVGRRAVVGVDTATGEGCE